MLLHSLHLIQPLQCTIVSLIQPPGFDDWNVVTVQLVGGVVECLDSSSQDRSVADVELETVLFEHLAGLNGLLDA